MQIQYKNLLIGMYVFQIPEDRAGSFFAMEICQPTQQCQIGDGANLS